MIRLRTCVGEGIRNALASGGRGIAFTLLFAGVTVAAAFIDGRALQILHDAERDAWHSGSHLVIVQSEGGVEGGTCEALNAQPVVVAAGAVMRTEKLAPLASRPGSPPTIVELTPGTHRLATAMARSSLTMRPAAAEYVASEQTANALQLRIGDRHRVAGVSDSLELVGTYDLSFIRSTSVGVFATRPPMGRFDACVVLAQPGRLRHAQAVAGANVRAFHPGEPSDVQAGVGDSSRDLVAEHRTRPTKHAWAAGGIALAAVWILLEALRRPERGLYLALGLSRGQLGVVRLTELLLLTAAGVLAATTLGATALALSGIETGIILPSLALSLLGASSCLVLGGVASAVLTRRGATIDMVKDRG